MVMWGLVWGRRVQLYFYVGFGRLSRVAYSFGWSQDKVIRKSPHPPANTFNEMRTQF